MIVDDIRRAKCAEPFQPFVIETTDGRSFLVDEYLHVVVAPNGRSVAVALSDGTFDYLHSGAIARVKSVTPASS